MGGVAWTAEEDHSLKKCIEKYGEGKWHRVPLLAGLNRCRKSCRLRWLNYLRPNIKRGTFADEEIELIIKLHKLLGNRWSLIAGRLPGRTANDVKNYWNCHLSKKLNALEADQEKQITTNNNVEVITPKVANLAMIPTMMRAKAAEGPSHQQQPVLQEGSKLGPAPVLQPVEDAVIFGHHGLKKKEDNNAHPAMEGHGFVGDRAVDFDDLFEEVKETYDGSSSSGRKWDWDDLIMDMDVWSELL